MRTITRFIAAALFFIIPAQVSAADMTIGSWQASGSQMWRTSFPTTQLPSGENRGASELRYPQSGTYITADWQQELAKNHLLRINAGFMGTIKSGIGSDSDWYHESDPNKWYYGEFTSSGHSSFVNVDWVQKSSGSVERFYGYSYRDNSFRMTNGIYFIEDFDPSIPYPNYLSGLDSTYKMIYQGPHIGWRYHSALTPKLAFGGMLSYTPLAYVHGHGWWNLRDLEFSHDGPGQMLDASVELNYAFSPSAALSVGYRYQYSSLFRGWEDTNSDISWDKATSIQRGFYVAGNLRF